MLGYGASAVNPYLAHETIKQMVDDTITSSWAEIINSASEEDCIAAFEAARDNCNAMGLEELTDYYENSYKANVEKYEG